ncbi:MAG: flagellar hook-length control protein FliK [Planctomycetes bacterium]|nr:flagellar hook-length control protein FliK [Planctomycetota bacterium]
MLTSIHGRIEADPMAFPQAANPADAGDAFASVLDAAIDGEPARQRVDARHVEDRRVDDVDAEVEADEIQAPAADELSRQERGELATLPTDAQAFEASGQATATHAQDDGNVADASLADRPTAPRGDAGNSTTGEPTRPAGKPSAEPLLAATLNPMAAQAAATAPVAAGTENNVGAIGAARGVAAAAPGPAAALARPNTPLATPAAAGSLRTNNAASAELIEQARDSVFKQILVKLTGEGGEMRLKLQPADLGELDLRLVMDQSNRLNLTIAAERQDMAHLLQRHLDELKHSLQQAGLEVAGAEVQTRGEFEREQRERDAQPQGGAAAAEQEIQPTTGRRRSFVRANGLDFWA